MAYADAKQNRTVALGSVALVHVGLGVALVSGLAVHFKPDVRTVIEAENIPLEPMPPEPVEPPPPEPRNEVLPREPVTPPLHAPVRTVDTPTDFVMATTSEVLPPPPITPVRVDPVPPVIVPPAPPAVDLSRRLQPRGDLGMWFPQDSYPAAARRAGAEGRVTVSVDVGANGRVTACRVVGSSGNEDLDGATCRLAARNGRFTPALNAAGEPVPGTLTLRPVRWTLEE